MARIKQWFTTLNEDYLSINLKDYPNINIDLPIVKLLLCAALAMIIAMIIISYSKKNMYTVVKQLMRHGALSEDKAKTLFELKLADSAAIKRAVISSSQVKSIVAIAGENQMSYEEYVARRQEKRAARKAAVRNESEGGFVGFVKRVWGAVRGFFSHEDEILDAPIDLEAARFYIKEEGAARASRIYNGSEITVLRTILGCLLIALVSICITLAMPELLSWIDGILA